MGFLETLNKALTQRPFQLQQAKDRGIKLIGLSGGYVPEELIHASGAIPVRHVRGGDPEPLAAAAAYMDRVLCPFARAQYGYRVLEDEPRYQMIDFLVSAITCQHMRRVADAWDIYTDMEVFRLGVPHAYNTEAGLQYYLEMVKRLQGRLETFLGTKIEEERLRKSVVLYNEMRSLFKEISFLRRAETPPLSGKEFIRLMHGSFYLDPEEMVAILRDSLAELKSGRKEGGKRKSRILLTGNMLAVGDYKVVDMVEDAGGSLVIEQLCGGIRHYLANVNLNGTVLEALARRYLSGREPCAFMRPSRERLDLVVTLAKEFNVDGVIWYQLRYCDTYNMEFFYFNNIMKEMGLPVLKLESEYDVEERGTLLNRIESFIESIERRK